MTITQKRMFWIAFFVITVVFGVSACSDDVARHTTSSDANNTQDSGSKNDSGVNHGQSDSGEQGGDGKNGHKLVASMVNLEKEAGDRFNFTCDLYGPDEQEIFTDKVRYVEPVENFEIDEFGLFNAIKTGPATAYCEVERYGLTSNRIDFHVSSARARTSKATVNRSQVMVGESVQVQCEAWDKYGNEVSEKYALKSLIVTPNMRVKIDGLQVTFEDAGSYEVKCKISGYPEGEQGTTVEVREN